MKKPTCKLHQTRILSGKLKSLFGITEEQSLSLIEHDFFLSVPPKYHDQWLQNILELFGQIAGRELILKTDRFLNLKPKRLEWYIDFFVWEGCTEEQARLLLTRGVKFLELSKDEFIRCHQALYLVLPDPINRRDLILTHPEIYLLPPSYLKQKRYLQWKDGAETFWSDLHPAVDTDGRPSIEETGENTDLHARDWMNDIKIASESILTDCTSEYWQKFIARNHWIFDRNTVSPFTLDEFATWLSLENVEDWKVKDARFIVEICHDENLHEILKLDRRILHFRLYILRRYLEIDFTNDPKKLLAAWENLPLTEIRFRIYTLQERKLDPRTDVWFHVLQAEKREEFLRSLDIPRSPIRR